MAGNDNRKKIRFRRGEEASLVSPLNTEKIAYGQPIYNATKNYLTIGDFAGDKLYKYLPPLDVRRVKGYFDDENEMSGVTSESKQYWLTGKSSNVVELYSQGGFELWTGSKACAPDDPDVPDAEKTFEVCGNQCAQFYVPMRADTLKTKNIKTSTDGTNAITLSNNLITLNKNLSSAYDITTNKFNGVLISDIFESNNRTTKSTTNVTSKDGVDSFVSVDEDSAARSLILGGPESTDFINITKGVLVNSDVFIGKAGHLSGNSVLYVELLGDGQEHTTYSLGTTLSDGDFIEVYVKMVSGGSLSFPRNSERCIGLLFRTNTSPGIIWQESIVLGIVGQNLYTVNLTLSSSATVNSISTNYYVNNTFITNLSTGVTTATNDISFVITRVLRYRR